MTDVIEFPKQMPPATEEFRALLSRLFEEIEELRCVEGVLDAAPLEMLGERVEAAHDVMIRSIERINAVHTAFEEWHLRARRPARAKLSSRRAKQT